MSGDTMGISITIQTHDRAEELKRTLETLLLVDTAGAARHEIMVVDNNSSDHTIAIVTQMAHRFKGALRYVKETKQGLSHARNRAIAESRFDVVGFLDDDVDVDREWLRAMTAAFSQNSYAAVGGRAFLVYPNARPRWLGERSEGLLTKVERGADARVAEPDELYGLNLCFRKEWLRRIGGFRTDLGRVGKCLLSSEETDVLQRISRAGGRLLYEPSAVVGHRVPAGRLRRRWFLSRSYWGKVSDAKMLAGYQFTGWECLRATKHFGLAGWDFAKALLAANWASEEVFFRAKNFAARLGYCVGLFERFWQRR